jgi:hypothetical protein
VLKPAGVLSVALLVSTPGFAGSLLVVCADEASRNLKDDITEVLLGAKTVTKVAGPKAPATSCTTVPASRKQECFATAGGAANVDALLLVTTSEKAGALSVTFELLSATDGKSVRREALRTTAAKFKAQAAPVLKRVISAASVKKAAPPPPPVIVKHESAIPEAMAAVEKTSDRPVVRSLEPGPSEPVPQVVAAPVVTATDSHAGAWVTTGVAVVAAGVAGTFGGLGLSNRAQLGRTTNGVSPLSYSQAQALQSTSNVQLSVALGATIAAGVSGGVAALLWSRN